MKPWRAIPSLGGYDVGIVRLGGPGLGNMLFPWARAVAAVSAHGGRLVWPTWSSAKPKRWLRRDRDMRSYGSLFIRPHNVIGGMHALALRLAPGAETILHHEPLPVFRPGGLYRFTGMNGLFTPIAPERKNVRAAFAAMAPITAVRRDELAVHVRLGDFRRPSAQAAAVPTDSTPNVSMPFAWYELAIAEARLRLGAQLPAIVYSDGSAAELAPLLDRVPGLRLADPGGPLVHLIAMSSSVALIACHSTFSMWAAFLADPSMPVFGPAPPWPDSWGLFAGYSQVPCPQG